MMINREGFRADNLLHSWLSSHAGGWQFGEQGILCEIAECFFDYKPLCIEIGAGDGEGLPLTIEPFYRAECSCDLFEIDESKRKKLLEKYPKAGVFDEWRPEATPNCDLVVIDVDGEDSAIMRQLLKVESPCLLMVEHFDSLHPVASVSGEPLPSWCLGITLQGGFRLQDSAESLKRIAADFGYDRIGTTRVNSIFVRRDLYRLIPQK